MTADDLIDEIDEFLAQVRRARRDLQDRERKERRQAIYSAAGLFAMVVGSLVAVYGIVILILRLIFR